MGNTPWDELHVLHGINEGYKSQDLPQKPGLEHASMSMPDQRTAGAATQGICTVKDTFRVFIILTLAIRS